jgi:DNA-binding IscR family transcriptional regulator
MQISTKFTIAIHVLTAVKYFQDDYKITSEFLSASVGSNPVIIRNIMSQLRESGIIDIKRGPGGISITRDLDQITFLDIYKAVETNSEEDFFRFHENPNPDCPVGKNIRTSLDGALSVIQDKFEAELKTHTVADVYETTLKAIQEQAK